MGTDFLVNGEPDDSVAAGDRGLAYGDGLFETVAIHAGRPLLWQEHLERLFEGCRRLAIPAPAAELLAAEAAQLAAGGDGVLKIIVTRGSGGRGYRAPERPVPTRILAMHPRPEYPSAFRREGVTVRLCELRLGGQPRLAGLKHLNRLEQVLARAEWDDPAIAEGIVLDEAGRLVEGIATNLFWVTGGELRTPALGRCGVAGVMRRRVLALAAQWGVAARVGEWRVDELWKADEIFLTNSLIGLWPVSRLTTGVWAPRPPGPLTLRLLAGLAAAGTILPLP